VRGFFLANGGPEKIKSGVEIEDADLPDQANT
jgi:hypothetical protein